MNMNVLGARETKRHTTIMDRITLQNKGIHIPDLD
jgi:hypothetical protein